MNWNNGYMADVEYTAGFFPYQSPTHLNFSCILNGIEPVPLDKGFTYCELGFGRGLTANILAAANPQGQFYATDFLPAHVAAAQQLADAAGLDNLTLLENSFAELADGEVDLPQFDFVTMYGVYTWVNDENRSHIVRFLSRYLKPGGVVYINYNAMPGWAASLPLQRLALAQQMYPGGTGVHLAETSRLVDALTQAGAKYFTANDEQITHRLRAMKHERLGYVAHEYMNHGWKPMYFVDVAQELAAAKLDFACAAPLMQAFPHLYLTQEQQQVLTTIPDPGVRETVKDYIGNIGFREDIFVRGVRRMAPRRRLECLASAGVALTVLRESAKAELKLPLGGTTNGKLHTAVLDALAQGPKPLNELAALPEFADTGLAGVAEVVGLMIAANQAAPYFLHASQADPGPAQRMNRVIAEHACIDDGYQAMASPLLGSGIQSGQVQRLLYRAISRHSQSSGAQVLFDDVWQVMEEQGCTCSEDAQDASPGKISRSRMAAVVDKVLACRVQDWRRLGMLESSSQS